MYVIDVRKNIRGFNLPVGKKITLVTGLMVALTFITSAQTESTNAPATQTEVKAEKGPPLPLHEIEGNGGIFSTLSAYLVNPPRNDELIGRPSIGFAYVEIGYGRNLEAMTLTETPWNRLELGYGYDNFNLGDLPLAIERATPFHVSHTAVQLHNANARLQLLKEGEYNIKWLPAITAGAHYKYNDGIKDIDEALNGTMKSLGISRQDGVDFTLYASKLFTQLPRPVLLNIGARATEAAHIGLLGFTDNYSFLFEGNAVIFLTEKVALAAEYRQKPDDYKPIPGLLERENDWWTIDAAYVVNKHLTIAAGYGHFGNVLNHRANGVWGITTKWEF